MNNRKIIRLLAVLLLAVLCLTLLPACDSPEDEGIMAFIPGEESGTFYFYGVEENGGAYFARILSEYQEEPAEDAFLYVPLATEIIAYFQENGVVGAWSPREYFSAEELAAADKENLITPGIAFTYGMADGRMDYLSEINPYEDFDVTTGEELVSD